MTQIFLNLWFVGYLPTAVNIELVFLPAHTVKNSVLCLELLLMYKLTCEVKALSTMGFSYLVYLKRGSPIYVFAVDIKDIVAADITISLCQKAYVKGHGHTWSSDRYKQSVVVDLCTFKLLIC